MANDTTITVVGNLVAAPELRFTPSGASVANFTVASTPRTFDRQANEWKDGEAMFLRCSVWGDYAENVAESLDKGMQVIVQGNLKARSYEDKEGNKRTAYEIDVLEVGPALRFARAQVQRQQRDGGQGGYQQAPAQQQRPQQGRSQQGGQADPWSQQAGGDYQWGAPQNDAPPF